MLNYIQQHTIDLYDLENKDYNKKSVSARSLVTVNRFDLIAKMAYIKYRSVRPDYAKQIYIQHIKAFNPDLKEPGRDDKNGIDDFVNAFDILINDFQENEFNSEISLIPVSEQGEILDGSHRVAALAFYDKDITILQFKDVKAIASFNYDYFLRRGLSRFWADAIVYEALSFIDNLFVACLWPRLGKIEDRAIARDLIRDNSDILYMKEISMSLENLSMFVYEIYNHQSWVGNKENNFSGARNKAINCYGKNKLVQFVFFKADNLEKVLKIKDEIRKHYKIEKHALHITDNDKETQEICDLILTEKGRHFTTSTLRATDRIKEVYSLYKNIYLINIKVQVAKVLRKIGMSPRY